MARATIAPRAAPAGAIATEDDGDAPPPARGATKLFTWSLPDRGPTGEVAVLVPQDADASESGRWPMLVALHGHGEAMKPPKDGAMGWPRDYALGHAISRVANPPLGPDDVEGFVDDARLAFYNASLAKRPYGGLVVVCPYVPELNVHSTSDVGDFARYLVDDVIARARRELPVYAYPEATGIDGVSMGGATALRAGLAHVETFGAVGALQPAITEGEADEWVEIVRAARARRPSLALRLTTSQDDVYEGAVTRLSKALDAAGVTHDFADVPGPHDYPFNRGPGAIEMLLWHDAVLRRG